MMPEEPDLCDEPEDGLCAELERLLAQDEEVGELFFEGTPSA